jgi:integrase
VGYAELAALVGRINWTSPKMRNNTLIPLRSMFTFAAKDGKFENHAVELKNAQEEDTIPDPLDDQERDLTLAYMRDNFHEQIWNFYEVAFYSGARPQEEISLKWIDMNWREDNIYIRRARKATGKDGPLKTYQQRKVRLNACSRAALQRQMKWTYAKPHGYIFENPLTGEPWVRKIGELRNVSHSKRGELGDERHTYFARAQLAARVRPRTPYHTRHTFITWAIMNGASVEWVARQVGHKNAKMIYEHYFDWIERAIKAADREVAKLDAAIASQGQSQGQIGGFQGTGGEPDSATD